LRAKAVPQPVAETCISQAWQSDSADFATKAAELSDPDMVAI